MTTQPESAGGNATDRETLHDKELPAPYPADSPGGELEGEQDSSGVADLESDADSLAPERD